MKKAKDKSARSKPDSTQPEKHLKGYIHNHKRTIARFEADTPEDYEFAKEVIDAGFRVKDNALEWGMNPDDYWQLACFPSDPDDWKTRMERLATHSLHDKDASDLGSLMHSCTWTLEQLWKWLQHLTEHAQNSNIKRDAGQALGRLYHEARQEEGRQKLGKANTEFERQMTPYAGITHVKEGTRKLWAWAQNEMNRQMDFWKRALKLADLVENKKLWKRSNEPDHLEQVSDLAEAWRFHLNDERKQFPMRTAAWHDHLDELEKHPFCTKNLSLSQLTEFDSFWKSVMYEVLKDAWKQDAEIRKIAGTNSFVKKFGDLKHMEGIGYKSAQDFFNRFYLLHWNQKQKTDRLLDESMKHIRRGTGTAVDPVAAKILNSAKQKKASAG